MKIIPPRSTPPRPLKTSAFICVHLRFLLAAALALSPGVVRAGDVEGTVTLPEKAKKRARPGAYAGAKPAGEYLRGPAVVFIDGVAAGAPFKPPAQPVVLEQKDRQFLPLALPVLAGTTVEFPNRDDEYHNVFSRSKPKPLELGRYGKDESRKEVFDKPGLVRLRCEIHTHMHAVIVVLENPYFAVADDKGAFAIKDVPAGTYRIYAFQEDYEPPDDVDDPLRAVGRDLTVAADGVVRADFDLTRK